jgi:hypothetical protein
MLPLMSEGIGVERKIVIQLLCLPYRRGRGQKFMNKGNEK